MASDQSILAGSSGFASPSGFPRDTSLRDGWDWAPLKSSISSGERKEEGDHEKSKTLACFDIDGLAPILHWLLYPHR